MQEFKDRTWKGVLQVLDRHEQEVQDHGGAQNLDYCNRHYYPAKFFYDGNLSLRIAIMAYRYSANRQHRIYCHFRLWDGLLYDWIGFESILFWRVLHLRLNHCFDQFYWPCSDVNNGRLKWLHDRFEIFPTSAHLQASEVLESPPKHSENNRHLYRSDFKPCCPAIPLHVRLLAYWQTIFPWRNDRRVRQSNPIPLQHNNRRDDHHVYRADRRKLELRNEYGGVCFPRQAGSCNYILHHWNADWSLYAAQPFPGDSA